MANATGRTIIFVDYGAPATLTAKVATDSGFTINVEYFVKSQIVSFNAVYNAQPGSAYPYLTQTMATVTFYDGIIWTFELQDLDATTYAAFVTGTPAACLAWEAAVAASL